MQEVLNQTPPLAGLNLFSHDRALHDAVVREGAAWASRNSRNGAALGTEEMLECGNLANEYPPVLRTHDRYGERRDEVVYHPSWHTLMRTAVGHGIHSLAWASPQPGAHVARAGAAENEAGHMCSVSMTYAAVPALRHSPKLASEWEPRICSTVYDPTFQPAPPKKGALVGMAMTENKAGRTSAPTSPAPSRSATANMSCTATNGSARPPCPTPFWCLRRPPAASPVSCCRVGNRTAASTPSICSA